MTLCAIRRQCRMDRGERPVTAAAASTNVRPEKSHPGGVWKLIPADGMSPSNGGRQKPRRSVPDGASG